MKCINCNIELEKVYIINPWLGEGDPIDDACTVECYRCSKCGKLQ